MRRKSDNGSGGSGNQGRERERDEERDIILEQVARLLVPFILMFGLYVVLNGHLSPGGGFSGGTVMGLSLIHIYVSIEVKRQQEDIRVSADPSLLEKAFQNVLNNCARYALSRVMVSLKREEDWAVICVEDDGPGLDENEIPHVFERFYKGSKGNFGIGLSVTRSAMEYMGGRVNARNRRPPCHGAEFQLLLPGEEPAGGEREQA